MKTNLKFGLAALAGMLWLFNASAQKKDPSELNLPKAPANVAVDGQLAEWGDSLTYNKESKLKYAIAADNDNLYVIAYIADRQTKRKIMAGGITIAINTEGKKRKTYTVTYPAPLEDNGDGGSRLDAITKQLNTMKVDGFKAVKESTVTMPDDYGFKGIYRFIPDGGMTYETAIPLKLLNMKPGSVDLFINIRLNGVDESAAANVPSSSTPHATTISRGSRTGGGSSGGGSDAGFKPANSDDNADMGPVDFWLKYAVVAH